MEPLFTLLLGHLIADFPLQAGPIYRLKLRGWAGVALHAGIHVAVTALLLRNPLRYWPALALLGGLHFATDWLKLRVSFNPQTPGFLLDQAAHVAVLALLAGRIPAGAAALPGWLLVPALLYALVPGLLTLLWTLANDLGRGSQVWPGMGRRARRRTLLLSQMLGMFGALGVSLGRLMIFTGGR